MTICRKCSVKLIIDENWFNSCSKRGERICKACHRADARKWEQDNQEEIAIHKRVYQQNHLQEIKNYNHEYGQKHRVKIMDYQRQWVSNRRKEEYARRIQWIRENPEKSREQSRRRRARLVSATIEPVDEKMIYSTYDRSCFYCGSKENLTLDHVVSLNKGGVHGEDNLVVACRKCNGGKSDRLLEDWLQTQRCALMWLY